MLLQPCATPDEMTTARPNYPALLRARNAQRREDPRPHSVKKSSKLGRHACSATAAMRGGQILGLASKPPLSSSERISNSAVQRAPRRNRQPCSATAASKCIQANDFCEAGSLQRSWRLILPSPQAARQDPGRAPRHSNHRTAEVGWNTYSRSTKFFM